MPISELSYEEIQAILNSGDFDKFIGVRENQFLEAKLKNPYNFESDPSHLPKLLKNIAGFCNSPCPGFLICGLRTESQDAIPHDIVTELDLMQESEFYEAATLLAKINNNISPKPHEISVKWYKSMVDSSLGLGVIDVPKQDENLKYFIIRLIEYHGEVLRGGYIGIPERNDEETDWVDIETMTGLVRKNDTDIVKLSSQIAEIKELIKSSSGFSSDQNGNFDPVGRIQDLIDE